MTVEELQAAVAARDELLSMLGHELRNAVSPLVLLSEMGGSPKPETLAKHVNKLAATIDRLTEVTRLHSGKMEFDNAGREIAPLLEQAVSELASEAKAAGIAVEIVADPALRAVCDRTRFLQVVRILVDNAIRYAPKGALAITAVAHDTTVEISFEDRGPGVAPHVLDKLFDRFARGLWIGRELCRAMGGSLVHDTSLDGGARFSITLRRG